MMLSRRDFLKLSISGLMASSVPGLDAQIAASDKPVPTIWKGSDRHRYFALTYDDCYLLQRLHDLEYLLDEFPGFKITLFPVGVAILNLHRQDSGIWNRLVENGHELGYHSWDHSGLHVVSPENAIADFDRWMEALIGVLGYQPRVHFSRPPYGVLSPSFDAIARARGQVVTMWSTGWGGDLPVGLKAAQDSKAGEIVLMHIRTQDVLTCREAYPWMRDNDWRSVTLTELYDDLLREQFQSEGCDVGQGLSLTRTCLDELGVN